jgi:hypothetical protein
MIDFRCETRMSGEILPFMVSYRVDEGLRDFTIADPE